MIRDPILRKIRERLTKGDLDRDKFQLAMGAVLRPEYPGLAVMTGGSDAGMDGSIADPEGPSFLVCTTGDDVGRNLRESLTSNKRQHARADGRKRQVVFVTSQALTNPRKRKLEQIAHREGFALLNIHDREDVAERLYHAPLWRKELLGIPGDPPALSALPAAGRYRTWTTLLGRDADRRWLFETSGDRFLLGVPGAGKTALVRELVEAGKALFLRRDASSEGIADAWRELEPPIIVVDDAHLDPSTLERLRTWRQEFEMEFSILATSWPGQRLQVADTLGLVSERQVRHLELLTRDEIVQLYQELGVEADERWMRELVDQAANRPGLAVTLAQLWKQGAWREIVEGSALTRFVEVALRQLVGEEAEDILAAFALGGKRGVPMQVVGEFLGLPLPVLRRRTIDLGAAGVFTGVGSDALAVHPLALRAALLAQTFLHPHADRLPGLERLLQRVPSPSAGLEAVLLGLQRGGTLPAENIRQLLLAHGSTDAWEAYAYLGGHEARWALDHFRGNLGVIARPLLKWIPETALPRLLERDLPPEGNVDSETMHPLRTIQDWVHDLDPDRFSLDDHLRRRELLVNAAAEQFRAQGVHLPATRALCLALAPGLEHVERDPGMGNRITMSWGILPADAYPRLEQLWEQVRPELPPLDGAAWKQFRSLFFELFHLQAPREATGQQRTQEAAAALAQRIVGDLVPLAAGHPGVSAALRRMGAPGAAETDPLLDLLFSDGPDDEQRFSDWRAEQRARIADLAASWVGSDPAAVAARLVACDAEGTEAGLSAHSNLSDLSQELAEAVAAPLEWLEAFANSALPKPVVAPFLSAAVRRRVTGWQEALASALEGPLAWWAVGSVLTADPPLDGLLPQALAVAARDPQLIEDMALTKQLPLQTLQRLFQEAPNEVALAAAIGHWCATPRGVVEPELQAAWRRVILEAPLRAAGEPAPSSHSFWLGGILASDPSLAFEWLRSQLPTRAQRKLLWLLGDEPVARALYALTAEHRIALIAELPAEIATGDLARDLVAAEPEAFRALLSRRDLSAVHLGPLRRIPDEAWWRLARIAIEFADSPREVAEAAFRPSVFGWGGSEAEYRARWHEAFQSRENSSDPALAAIAREGMSIAAREVEAAQARDKQLAMKGL